MERLPLPIPFYVAYLISIYSYFDILHLFDF